MILSFACKHTQALHEDSVPDKRFRVFARQAKRKLVMLHAAVQLRDLASPPGNRLEALKGNRERQHSIRINDQWRICFRWHEGNAYDVEICDYH